MFRSLKCRILSFKTVVGKLCKFHIIKYEKTFVSKWKAKVIFRGSCRLPGLLSDWKIIIDVGCNLERFDGLT